MGCQGTLVSEWLMVRRGRQDQGLVACLASRGVAAMRCQGEVFGESLTVLRGRQDQGLTARIVHRGVAAGGREDAVGPPLDRVR